MQGLLRSFAFLLLSAVLFAVFAADQDELSEEEREYYDLNLRFAARVILNNGTRIELTDFHLGHGRHRHWLLTAGRTSLYIPLRTITRIERIRDFADRANLFLVNESKMGIVWARTDEGTNETSPARKTA